jgi:hypothetical protein
MLNRNYTFTIDFLNDDYYSVNLCSWVNEVIKEQVIIRDDNNVNNVFMSERVEQTNVVNETKTGTLDECRQYINDFIIINSI